MTGQWPASCQDTGRRDTGFGKRRQCIRETRGFLRVEPAEAGNTTRRALCARIFRPILPGRMESCIPHRRAPSRTPAGHSGLRERPAGPIASWRRRGGKRPGGAPAGRGELALWRPVGYNDTSAVQGWRRTQVAKGEVCKTSMQRFESARRLHPRIPQAPATNPEPPPVPGPRPRAFLRLRRHGITVLV